MQHAQVRRREHRDPTPEAEQRTVRGCASREEGLLRFVVVLSCCPPSLHVRVVQPSAPLCTVGQVCPKRDL